MEVFTVKEASKKLKIGVNTMYQLINEGKIRCFSLGERNKRIPDFELDRFVMEQLRERGER